MNDVWIEFPIDIAVFAERFVTPLFRDFRTVIQPSSENVSPWTILRINEFLVFTVHSWLIVALLMGRLFWIRCP